MRPCPKLATDIIIENERGIVLIDRLNPPYGIAICGGYAEVGITLEENAIKEAMEETGLEVMLYNPEKPFCVKSDPKRDPREHIVSTVYIGWADGTPEAGSDAKKTLVFSNLELSDLLENHPERFAFPDHHDILSMYLKARNKIPVPDFGFLGIDDYIDTCKWYYGSKI
ncbi:NUDIX hydrolase [Candidatus Woesearchaeota archaeon]|nr:NUDIX hydrolase [Candidatus Woesearchaeota archaeon]